MHSNTHAIYALLGEYDWHPMAIPAAGLGVTVLILIASFLWSRRRKETAEEVQEAAPVADPFLQGSRSDRRQTPRRVGQAIKVTVQIPEDEKDVFDSYVLDRSMGGLRLMMDRQVEFNQILNVRSSEAPETITYVQVQVRRVNQMPDKKYEVGCQFVRTPPWAILLTFG